MSIVKKGVWEDKQWSLFNVGDGTYSQQKIFFLSILETARKRGFLEGRDAALKQAVSIVLIKKLDVDCSVHESYSRDEVLDLILDIDKRLREGGKE